MKNSIFKCLITALLIQFVCTLKAQVTYTVNGIVYYAVDKEASVVESQSGYKGEVIIPQSVRLKLPMVMSYVEKTLPVTSISSQAFSKSRELLKVGIPNSITYIGDCAFEGCSGLSTIVLPNSVKTIGFYAFQNCVGLYEITLPNSIEYIEEGLFKGCNKIRVIKCYNPNPPSIGYEAFETEVKENAIVYVPKGLKEKYKTNPYWKGFANISDDSENISSVGSSTSPIAVHSQTIGSKKIYSGELNLRDLQNERNVGDNGIEATWGNCRGSYQYISSADGRRIFDGYFKFQTASGSIVEGEFKQNKQVGIWEYQYSSNNTTKINFVDGIPQGSFVVHNPRKVALQCKGTIQNGKLHSYFIFEMKYPSVTVSGQYNREGKPIDEWNIWINGKKYTSEYDQNGNRNKRWYRINYDESTGDKNYIYADIDSNYSPEWVGRMALNFLSLYTLRDSKLKK